MSAIRVIRHEDNTGSRAVFESTGMVILNVEDLGSGDYANGIYVSGEGNEVVLNDSIITIKGGANSAALRIGKGRSVGTGGGTIKSYGQMLLDTTASPNVSTVHMIGRDSELNAAFIDSSSVIKSAHTAILYSRMDYLQSFSGSDQRVALRNAQVTTTSSTAPLIQVDQDITASRFDLSGDNSLIVAANDGWLINVNPSAELNVTLSEQGTIAKGLTNVANNSLLNMTVQDGAQWQLAPKSSLLNDQTAKLTALTLTNGGMLNVGHNLTDSSRAAYSVEVPVFINNKGIINMHNSTYADTLTIKGDYQGDGGSLYMNTLWNAPGDGAGANSSSDQLVITGHTLGNGSTVIHPVTAGGQEAIIDGDIRRLAHTLNSLDIVVTGGTYDGAFIGTARTTGAGEAQLVRNGDNFRWTLKAQITPDPSPDPDIDIFAPEVPGYVQMPHANLEMGYTMLSTLHERVGEQQALSWDGCDTCAAGLSKQTWGRMLGRHQKLDGRKRLNFDMNTYGLQIGQDFHIQQNPNNNSRRHSGVYASYAHAKTDFYDENRAVNGIISGDKYMGKGSTDRLALGVYSTYYTEQGSYLDMVGELAYLRNKYQARNGAKTSQNGYSAAASIEVGKPIHLGNSNWLVEPQSQLIYQYLNLNNINDGLKSVQQKNLHALRGRIGARLAYNKEGTRKRTNTFYIIGNIWHDLSASGSVKIGQDKVREKYNRTWIEGGVGAQTPIGKQSYLYVDARYEHSLSKQRRMGYRGMIGLNYHW